MSNRRLEVFHYRQVLYQMQQGMSDRAIALGGTMGRRKAAQLRCKAATEGWLTPGASLPDDATLAALFITAKHGNTGPVSTLEVHRERITQWVESGINARVMHRIHTVTGEAAVFKLVVQKNYATFFSRCVQVFAEFSGLSQTSSTRFQFLVFPLQRNGRFRLAS